ncbi:hypothetical protein [Micromonospora sp. DT31]|uniref:hypothetical protein n=1 Tax=Micromonospora sp. DT31 TaxID=3393434 RepID=UPI003CEBD183
MRLPECAGADLRYWYGDYLDDVFYLTFRADAACVDAFRDANGPTRVVPLPTTTRDDSGATRQVYLRGVEF